MPGNRSRPEPPETCPVCGEDVPRNALACRECGADHRSGWNEEADEADLPDDEFDYDDFVQREFGGGARPRGIHPVWWITALVLLAAFFALVVFGR